MRFNDALFGLALIGFALVAALAAQSFPEMPGQNYGPALFPRLVCAGLAICGGLLVASGVRQRASQPLVDLEPWARSARGLGDVGLVIAALVFYILASEDLGFIPTAFIVVAAIIVRLRGRWVSSLLIAAAATLAVHKVFAGLLLVPLPWGVLESLVY